MTKERFVLPTQERLRELFDYNPETGVVTAKGERRTKGGWGVGAEIGYLDSYGYLKVTIEGHPLMLHRVIWKLMTGQEPTQHLDHINRVKHDNRWANLREATAAQNNANKGLSIANSSGAKGVQYGYKGRWTASIVANGQQRSSGTFETREAAIDAYNAAAVEIYGAFAHNEVGPNRIVLDVLTLVDEQLLAAVSVAARSLFATRLDPTLPEAAKAKLEDIGLTLSTELARIDPKNYGQMRKRAA